MDSVKRYHRTETYRNTVRVDEMKSGETKVSLLLFFPGENGLFQEDAFLGRMDNTMAKKFEEPKGI